MHKNDKFMVYKARLLLSGRQKIATALLMLLAIAVLANYPRITEALLAFLLGGVVPGTNIIVSPDVVLLVVFAIFVVGIVGSIIRMYFKAAHGKRNFRIAVQAIESVTVLPVARDTVIGAPATVGVKASAAVRKRHAFRMFTSATFRKVGHVLSISSGVIGRAISRAVSIMGHAVVAMAKGIWKGMSFVAEAIYTLLVLVWFGIEASAKFMARATSKIVQRGIKIVARISVWTVRSLQRAWRNAVPFMKRFDSGLEVRLRALEAGIRGHLQRYETVRAVNSMGHEYRKSIRDLHPKKVLKTARHSASTIKPKMLVAPRSSRLKG